MVFHSFGQLVSLFYDGHDNVLPAEDQIDGIAGTGTNYKPETGIFVTGDI